MVQVFEPTSMRQCVSNSIFPLQFKSTSVPNFPNAPSPALPEFSRNSQHLAAPALGVLSSATLLHHMFGLTVGAAWRAYLPFERELHLNFAAVHRGEKVELEAATVGWPKQANSTGMKKAAEPTMAASFRRKWQQENDPFSRFFLHNTHDANGIRARKRKAKRCIWACDLSFGLLCHASWF